MIKILNLIVNEVGIIGTCFVERLPVDFKSLLIRSDIKLVLVNFFKSID